MIKEIKSFHRILFLQVTFIFLVYPALILCYAGQAAFFSRHLGASDDAVHLSESVTQSKFDRCFFIRAMVVASSFEFLILSYQLLRTPSTYIHDFVPLCFPRG